MLLVDTDVMIDLLRCHQPALDWLSRSGDDFLLVPGFVAMELIQGCRNKTEQRGVRDALEAYGIVWPSEVCCKRALATFAQQYLKNGLGIIDTLVGETAVEIGVPLATFNTKHYAAIPGIKILQPYAR